MDVKPEPSSDSTPRPRRHVGLRERLPAVGWIAVLATLLVLGAALSHYKVSLIRHIQFVGHSDRAAYAEMARSLAEGRGLQVDYVSWFFVPYGREITRREDHWPPLLAFVTAPFMRVLGTDAWVAKLPPILIASIALPLVTAALGLAFSGRAVVGLVAGLLMMVNGAFFTQSLQPMSDLSTATLVAGFCAALLAARQRPWLYVPAGLCAGLAFYSKESELLLLGIYPAAAVLAAGGFGVLKRKGMWLGWVAAIMCVAPWLVSNYRTYGRVLYSTQQFVGGYYELDDWEACTFRPYWGQDLPHLSDRWTKYADKYRPLVRANAEQCARFALLGPEARPGDWRLFTSPLAELRTWLQSGRAAGPLWTGRAQSLCGLLAVVLLVVVLLAALARTCQRRLRWKNRPAGACDALAPVARAACPPVLCPGCHPHGQQAARGTETAFSPAASGTLSPGGGSPVAHAPAPPQETTLPASGAIVLILLAHAAVLIFLWAPSPRLAFLFLPPITVLGSTAAWWVLEWPLRIMRPAWAKPAHGAVAAGLSLLVLEAALGNSGALKAYQAARSRPAYPYTDQSTYPLLGQWIREHLPNAVIMSRNPWELHFHAGRDNRTVNVPWASAEEVFRIAEYYHVTHYLADGDRPAMAPFVNGQQPGLKPVPGAPDMLFEVQYDRLPWRHRR